MSVSKSFKSNYVEIRRADGLQWRHFDSVTSTMDVARAIIPDRRGDARWWGLVTADKQSSGRGRQGRVWEEGQVTWMGTFVFPTVKQVAQLSGYSLGIGVGVARACEQLGSHVSLKWPNDIVVERNSCLAKLGGILIELEDNGTERFVLVGVGLNVTGVPFSLQDQATSLSNVSDKSFSIGDLTERLLTNVGKVSQEMLSGESSHDLLKEWEKKSCFQLGRTRISVQVSDRVITGIYEGLADGGALRLQTGNGEHEIHSGHIQALEL